MKQQRYLRFDGVSNVYSRNLSRSIILLEASTQDSNRPYRENFIKLILRLMKLGK